MSSKEEFSRGIVGFNWFRSRKKPGGSCLGSAMMKSGFLLAIAHVSSLVVLSIRLYDYFCFSIWQFWSSRHERKYDFVLHDVFIYVTSMCAVSRLKKNSKAIKDLEDFKPKNCKYSNLISLFIIVIIGGACKWDKYCSFIVCEKPGMCL